MPLKNLLIPESSFIIGKKYAQEYAGVEMLQKNHHFLFPQTYFGPIEQELFDDEEEEEEDEMDQVPWVLVLETDKMQLDTKIGLYIHWIE